LLPKNEKFKQDLSWYEKNYGIKVPKKEIVGLLLPRVKIQDSIFLFSKAIETGDKQKADFFIVSNK